MFTNWLTSPITKVTTSTNATPRADGRLPNGRNNDDRGILSLPNDNINNNNDNPYYESVTTMINSNCDADILIEIGPGPSGSVVRFMAHSLILSAHSGYLRSAIRMDDRQTSSIAISTTAPTASSLTNQHNSTNTTRTILYLNNVTHEQFAPLLNYMYTGYLHLNAENIFGILLATHVLHMPRALEICRSYLARAQSEAYFQSSSTNNNNNNNNNNSNNHHNNESLYTVTNGYHNHHHYNNNNNNNNHVNTKIIRPIASKPTALTLTNLGFLPLGICGSTTNTTLSRAHLQEMLVATPLPPTTPAAAPLPPPSSTTTTTTESHLPLTITDDDENDDIDTEDTDIDVDEVERQSLNNMNLNITVTAPALNEATDEDEDVFIDSNSESDNIMAGISIEKSRLEKVKQLQQQTQQQQVLHRSIKSNKLRIKNDKNNDCRNKNNNKKKSLTSLNGGSGLNNFNNSNGIQKAKAPVHISQLTINNNVNADADSKKVIIDVASCDGPVRFKRILNTAYGKAMDNIVKCPLNGSGNCTMSIKQTERSQKSLSLSFHQQMAKTISQHHNNQHQQHQNRHRSHNQIEEAENSEQTASDSSSLKATASSVSSLPSSSSIVTCQRKTNDIYVCVYCKHTFKSQYCYQKHAKRHLNPLNLPSSSSSPSSLSSTSSSQQNDLCNQMNRDRIIVKQQQQPQQQKYDKISLDNAMSTTTTQPTSEIISNNQHKRSPYLRQLTKNHSQQQQQPQQQQQQQQNHARDEEKWHQQQVLQQSQLDSLSIDQQLLLKRDIKPLDMNVQYFPCKTCGCKFPSYYFVHKHRKMCHADDDQYQNSINNNNNNNITMSSSSSTPSTTITTTIITTATTTNTTKTLPSPSPSSTYSSSLETLKLNKKLKIN